MVGEREVAGLEQLDRSQFSTLGRLFWRVGGVRFLLTSGARKGFRGGAWLAVDGTLQLLWEGQAWVKIIGYMKQGHFEFVMEPHIWESTVGGCVTVQEATGMVYGNVKPG